MPSLHVVSYPNISRESNPTSNKIGCRFSLLTTITTITTRVSHCREGARKSDRDGRAVLWKKYKKHFYELVQWAIGRCAYWLQLLLVCSRAVCYGLEQNPINNTRKCEFEMNVFTWKKRSLLISI